MIVPHQLRATLERTLPQLLKQRLRRRVLQTPLDLQFPYELELRLMQAIVPRGRPFIDVGANVGVYSIVLEDVVGAANLYCCEPLPQLYQRLRRLLPKAHVYNVALSDHSGSATISVPTVHGRVLPTRATLERDVQELSVEVESTSELTVATLTLDDLCAQANVRQLGAVKIDVEGHEQAVLRGAERTLAQHQPLLLVEIEQRHHRTPISTLLAEVEQRGYTGFFIDRPFWRLRPLAEFDLVQAQGLFEWSAYINNFLFVPLGRKAELAMQAAAVVAAWHR